MIIDTDVLIWYLKGNIKAQHAININIPFRISVINYLELIQGMKDKNELRSLQKTLKKWSTEIIQINENISNRAMFLVENYGLSYSMRLAEAIIAASALECHDILLTANEKHYSYIPNIKTSKFKPK